MFSFILFHIDFSIFSFVKKIGTDNFQHRNDRISTQCQNEVKLGTYLRSLRKIGIPDVINSNI